MKMIEITSQVFNSETNEPIGFKVIDEICEINPFGILPSDDNDKIVEKYQSYSWSNLQNNHKVKVLLVEWKN